MARLLIECADRSTTIRTQFLLPWEIARSSYSRLSSLVVANRRQWVSECLPPRCMVGSFAQPRSPSICGWVFAGELRIMGFVGAASLCVTKPSSHFQGREQRTRPRANLRFRAWEPVLFEGLWAHSRFLAVWDWRYSTWDGGNKQVGGMTRHVIPGMSPVGLHCWRCW